MPVMPQTLLIHHIRRILTPPPAHQPLSGKAQGSLHTHDDAWLLIEDGRIVGSGSMSEPLPRAERRFDAEGGMVLPAFVDAHTHLVFAASREGEFVDRIRGLSYQEIARRGGGILNSALRLRQTSEEALFAQAMQRLEGLIRLGTGAIEIKSGYGLDTESELKMLRVIRRMKEAAPVPVRATFLGAHALPPEYRDDREGYLALIEREMLPRIADEGLADYMDVFCEKVAFSVDETDRLLEAADRYGLRPRIHTNQFHSMGGIEVAVRHGAISVDHLEVVNDEEIRTLAASDTMATLLPSAPFFLNDPYPPARRLIEAGIPVVLASDYNPGSSPSGNMWLVWSLACIKMRMLPEEGLVAATLNAAHSLGLADHLGSIAPGKKAHLIVTRPAPSLAYLPYSFGENHVRAVLIGNQWYF